DLRGPAMPAVEDPAITQLGLRTPGDAHHPKWTVSEMQSGGIRLAVLVDSPWHVVVGVDVADVGAPGEGGQGHADEHRLPFAPAPSARPRDQDRAGGW